MSGPFRFTQEPVRSPLDQRPLAPLPVTQPVSYKTNVNRMKTQKWVTAKKNTYTGDDWGEYDEYDEYGAQEPLPPTPANPAIAESQAYGHGVERAPRNFTEPQRQLDPLAMRRNSFETGDEKRSFSSSMVQSQAVNQPYNIGPIQDLDHIHPALRQTSATSEVSDTPQHRRDFSASALPQPLHPRSSPTFENDLDSPKAPYPPRKSSISQADTGAAFSQAHASAGAEKSPSIIRPADIYKRVEEARERERASLDSSRPSLDAPGSDKMDPGREPSKSKQGLETVAERSKDSGPAIQAPIHPSLPPVQRVSTFGSDFWNVQPGGNEKGNIKPSADQGLRSLVNQAFTRVDDSQSVPPTPISKSGVSRSNTESTVGISPAMSIELASGTSAFKVQNQPGADSVTPAIAEETEAINLAARGTTISNQYQPIQSTSGNPFPRATETIASVHESPTQQSHPALHGAQTSSKHAEMFTIDSASSEPSKGSSNLADPSYAAREADIAAAAIQLGPTPELKSAAETAQQTFVDTHKAGPLAEMDTRSRSESPSKGRIHELAGKFGEVSHSRRGSAQSMQSWEKSQDNSRPSSPTKVISTTRDVTAARPVGERELSFRPKLPGQWESYATYAPTPSEHEYELGTTEGTMLDSRASTPPQDKDLTPTTKKHALQTEAPSATIDPLNALKAAGSAMAEALQASVGLGKEPNHEAKASEQQQLVKPKDRLSYGDVFPRPLQFDRAASPVSSSAPTPPAKDTPELEFPPKLQAKEAPVVSPLPSSSNTTHERPSIVSQLSTVTSIGDQESDKLRKEIVASLTPVQPTASHGSEHASEIPIDTPGGRASSVFPSEYDNYWADGGVANAHVTQNQIVEPDHRPQANRGEIPNMSHSTTQQEPQHPSLLTRFSWEGSPSANIQSAQRNSEVSVHHNERALEKSVELPPVVQQPTEKKSAIYAVDNGNNYIEQLPQPRSGLPTTESLPEGPIALAKPAQSKVSMEDSRAPGLHVVNTGLNPEAVDVPPRLSREVSPVSPIATAQRASHEDSTVNDQTDTPKPQISMATGPKHSSDFGGSHHTSPNSPTIDKPLGFRDIATMKSPSARIESFDQTREYWAKADHGLNEWLSSAVAATPDLVAPTLALPSANLAPSVNSRHKATGSISLFSKHVPSQTETYSPSASQISTAPSASPSGSGTGRGAKGKEFLVTGAKGLFAKGKSRFNREKA